MSLHMGDDQTDGWYTKCGINWQYIEVGDGVVPEKLKDEPLPDKLKNYSKCKKCWK